MISFRSVLIAVVLAGALPSQAGLFSDDEARKSLYDLRAEFLQYKAADEARLTRLETNIDTLQQANNRIQQSLDRLDQAIRNLNLPALQTQLESVSSDVAKLNGSVEVQTNVIEQDQKRNKEFYLDLDSRLRALEKTGGAGAVFPAPNKSGQASDALKSPPGKKDEGVVTASEGDASASASSSETPPKTSNAAASSGPQAVSSAAEQKSYDQAYQAFKASNFVMAVKEFQSFNKTYPRSVLSANAGFWLGVSQYRLKAYSAAETALKAVASQYPDSPKAPDALLNLASVQLDAGNANAAHDSLEELIAHYPASDAAAKAKARLGRK